MVFFYLVTTGWIFDISLFENNQPIKVQVFPFFFSHFHRFLAEKDAAQVIQILVINTDGDSYPAAAPKGIRAKAPKVNAIATTATPDGAGSQTQEMGETSSDSDGGEDQD